jgi:hypothetical protein
VKKERREKKQDKTPIYLDADRTVTIIAESFTVAYDRKIRNLQFIALMMVLIISIISPLRLIEARSTFNFTSMGFVVASFVPAMIAIFDFMPGRKLSLLLSTFIYAVWILIQSTFFWEAILVTIVLIIYFEVTWTIQMMQPILQDVKSTEEGGTYYHANVMLGRYLKFLLLFTGIITGISIVSGIIGWYVIEPLQSDIIFAIFMIICLALIIILARLTLTPDIEKLLLEEQRKEMEKRFAESHARYS